jgi:hypothetical protein
MEGYSTFKRGSEWRKWDLHFHTLGTNKNDQFTSSDFDSFCVTLFKKAIQNEIAVLGVTDYFSIDNYKKVVLFAQNIESNANFDADEREKVKDIFILPNVELRMLPVTDSGRLVNIHFLFNPSYVADLDNDFFSTLKHHDGTGSDHKMNRHGFISLGKSLDPAITDDEAAYKKGVESFVLSHEQIKDLLNSNSKLRKNSLVAVSNSSTDGASGLQKHYDLFENEVASNLQGVRKTIYYLSDCVFSSNPSDHDYFLGKKVDDEETVIRKCGSLKPCIHGSDAHKEDELFNPEGNRFCWIKADPTFEGLKQILYEPEDRVKIQAFRPDVKNARHVISSVQFKDASSELFSSTPILLNENLNSIIGGKSAGKSLLLYSIAKSIDPEQVEKTQDRLGFQGYSFSSTYDFEVEWQSGAIDKLTDTTEVNQKIIYIPQLYINYLVERDNKKDLNTLVESILLQDTEFRTFYGDQMKLIADLNTNIDSLLRNYLNTRIEWGKLYAKSKDLGKAEAIQKAVEAIQKAINEGQKLSNLNEEEFKKYNELLEQKSKLQIQLTKLDAQKSVLESIVAEVQANKGRLLGSETPGHSDVKGSVDRFIDQLAEVPEEINQIKQKLGEDYDQMISNLTAMILELKIEERTKATNDAIVKTNTDLKPYLDKIAGQKELQKLAENLEKENRKYSEAVALEKQMQTIASDYHNLRSTISGHLSNRVNLYKAIMQRVNETRNDIGSGVTLECRLVFKKEDFPLFHQANKASIGKDNADWNSLYAGELVNYEAIPDFFAKPLIVRQQENILTETGASAISIPLRQSSSHEEVLQGLVKDSFILDYTVTYKGDDLLRMSPGKKGTVLLILFLQISSSEYPILLDQPEDNLDNRTIYELLCRMIKEKKKERQIIMVSHNANLVVSTDSENIIVANQAGQDGEGSTSQFRFEYVNGSIEFTFPENPLESNVLLKQGIREHVCDILEGGDEAFKQRERKYALTN